MLTFGSRGKTGSSILPLTFFLFFTNIFFSYFTRYRIADVEPTTILDHVEAHLGADIEIDYENYEDCDNECDLLEQVSRDYNLDIEVHSDSLSNSVVAYSGKQERCVFSFSFSFFLHFSFSHRFYSK